MSSAKDPSRGEDLDNVPFIELVRIWARIGILSFGGPTAQIALMHRLIVDEKKWLTERQYLNALGFCMLLPGPEAMQLATYTGWRSHGLKGGLAAGLLFVAPGALVVLVLAMIYAAFGNVPFLQALFLGIKAAVLIIVIEALLRIARRALHSLDHWLIAGLSFVAIFFLALPFPLIILGAALYGALRGDTTTDQTPESVPAVTTSVSETAATIFTWFAVWVAPLGLMALVLGSDHVLSQLGWFFSKLAVVSFGGAYAGLAYMGQDVVQHHQWLEPGQMIDGLGLAETTPGPLILVTEFVGYLAAHSQGGDNALAVGVGGAAVALWATFAPCFLWIFAGAPYIEWINGQPRLRAALAAITAAVVGVILNLAVWFALHVFFGSVEKQAFGILDLWVPAFASLDWRVVVLAALSGYLLVIREWGIAPVLAVSASLALCLSLFGV